MKQETREKRDAQNKANMELLQKVSGYLKTESKIQAIKTRPYVKKGER